jgi:predicted ferric reductase
MVPDWKEADVWFCGPAAFGDALRTGLVSKGLPAQDFHRELFEMR